MGTACAVALARPRRHTVRLWLRSARFAQTIREQRRNDRRLPGVTIPDDVGVTSDPETALADATIVLFCVPTRSIREAARTVVPFLPEAARLVSAAKGIETTSLVRPSQMLQEVIGNRPVTALGGPCHAEELARSCPTSVVAACDDLSVAEQIRDAFSNGSFRVYSSGDLAGVELGGALKNVMAIAAGICAGLKLGDNAQAALITRGLAEMVRFCRAMQVAPETLYGLAGVGDLIVTCGSRHSRNRHVGELLGQGMSLPEIEASMQAVAEGVFTVQSVRRLARQENIEMPIAEQVYQVLFENRSPREATDELLQRPLRSE